MPPAERRDRETLPVAAVVPSRDSPWLRKVVEALTSGRVVPQEVVVVDDGSRVAVGELRGARVIRTAAVGRGGARNAGAGDTTAPYLWFVDSDVLVSPDTLSLLYRAVEDAADGAMAIYDDHGGGGYEGFRLVHQRYHVLRNPRPRHLSAACLLIRRSSFEEIGGFPDLPAMEDIAFGVAGWRKGLRWRTVTDASVVHLPRGSLRRVLLRDHRERGMAAARLVAREGPVLEHAGSKRDLVGFAGSLALLAGAVPVPQLRRLGLAGLALWCYADGPWLRHAYRQRGAAFTAASFVWLLLFRSAVAAGFLRAYAERLA
jgi:Glycosyl transferase family 2